MVLYQMVEQKTWILFPMIYLFFVNEAPSVVVDGHYDPQQQVHRPKKNNEF